ncbi:MAG: DMT family transporter [Betaproteobacteria bacterium]
MNTVPTQALPHDPRARSVALVALFAGAIAIATAPLFVKVSETGPVATAFWRVFLALPFLFFWAFAEGARGAHASRSRREWIGVAAAGLFFAGDLAVWHWSIVLTSVANSTLLANLAPIFVTLAAWLIFRQRPAVLFAVGLAAALGGVSLLVGANFRVSELALLGDALGVVTAMIYAAYQITVTRLRGTASTAHIMAYSSAVMAAALLPIALLSGDRLLPDSGIGWLRLFGLALFAQVAGQSLIAYAMAHLPATFSSVGLLLQPVAAALFAWILLGETLTAFQMVGAVFVLAGIRIAHQAAALK